MGTKEIIMARVRELGVACEYYEHAPAHTMEDCLALPYAEPDVTFCRHEVRQLTHRSGAEISRVFIF